MCRAHFTFYTKLPKTWCILYKRHFFLCGKTVHRIAAALKNKKLANTFQMEN